MRPFAEIDALYREATLCRECFQSGDVTSPLIDIAQPRWIGPRYFVSSTRIAILMLNPGSGDGRLDDADRKALDCLKAFSKGKKVLREVFDQQSEDMRNWGRGRFIAFYTIRLGLVWEQIAMANIAWCATRGNSYPRLVLDRCFSKHTSRLLQLLAPDIVLLSGSATHRYCAALAEVIPGANIIPMMHFAHREGRIAEEQKLRITRQAICEAKKAERSSEAAGRTSP